MKMKKETLKDWCKKWDIKTIVQAVFMEGMQFQVGRITNEEANKYQRIIVKELKSRISKKIVN
mgnify:CR=1 FL=1